MSLLQHRCIRFAAYGNANFNAIYENWYKQNKYITYSSKKLLDKLVHKAIEYTEKSIITRAQKKLLKLLAKEKIEASVVEDIAARLEPFTAPSAIYKIKAFLKHHELYPDRMKPMTLISTG